MNYPFETEPEPYVMPEATSLDLEKLVDEPTSCVLTLVPSPQ
jgi:hypothetical protein